jgi:hypothetical protein
VGRRLDEEAWIPMLNTVRLQSINNNKHKRIEKLRVIQKKKRYL